MKENKFAVIGLGQLGKAIALTLSERGGEVIAIDNSEENVEEIADEVAYAVTLDATDKKALMAQNIQEMDAVVVAIGEDFESLLLCTVLLKELKVKRIIARARGHQQRMILEKIGVKEILSPELEVGALVAERLLNPSLLSILQLPDEHEIAEIRTPKRISNRKFAEIDFYEKYNLSVIALKREFELLDNAGENKIDIHIVPIVPNKTILYQSDTLIIFGKTKDIERFIDINQ